MLSGRCAARQRGARLAAALLGAGALAALPPAPAGPPALESPPPAVLAEARALVARMERAERGPYERLRWFCNDGTVLPPTPYACREHGGGRQHAEYSADRRRLAELGWHVGTIFAATSFASLWQPETRQQRLRELALERYLIDVADGWVLRRAQSYRGRVQIEGEEAAGRGILLELLARPGWAGGHYLLLRELARVVPHHGGSDRTRTVRRLAQEIAERDPSFEAIRVRVHSVADARQVEDVRRWAEAARGRGTDPVLVAKAEQLAQEMERLYGTEGRRERLRAALARLAQRAGGGEPAGLVSGVEALPRAPRIARLAVLMARMRDRIAAGGDAPAALALLDLSFDVEAEIMASAAAALREPGLSRRRLLEMTRDLLAAGYGAGLLSAGEQAALTAGLEPLLDGGSEVATGRYLAAVRRLQLAPGWAAGAVRYAFAEPLVRYAALEPIAARFPDDLLRGSVLLPLAETVRRLALDAERRYGVAHSVFGAEQSGLLGLNPGVATGRLRVVGGALEGQPPLGPGDVVVLPQTVSELPPVAGILTAGEGNLLSHVQILARNLGIPNVAIPPELARGLAASAGEPVLLAVGGGGSVVLQRLSQVPARARELLAPAARAEAAETRLEVPAPDLSLRDPLPLSELHASLSGRVVGPKAANVGELARLFPGRVAPAVALPFGVFAEHLRRGGEDSPRARLERAFARYRAGALDEAGLAAELDAIRAAVEAIELSPELRARLRPMMAEAFGPPGSYGLFVRSDTNVEDLPGFTGAGLNRTLPNVVGLEAQLAAVPQVWASVFGRRSMAWRAGLLRRPEEVYASVLMMKSVPSDKSGVLVTADLIDRGAGLTVSCAWGPGGAVDGEVAETLVLREDGGVTLVSEAKTPWRRALDPAGGVTWEPAPAGPVLSAREQGALRALAGQVRGRYPAVYGADGRPLPWDIEFGFVGGELRLFQIRPLVERGRELPDRVIAALAPAAPGGAPGETPLDAPPDAPAPAAGGGGS